MRILSTLEMEVLFAIDTLQHGEGRPMLGLDVIDEVARARRAGLTPKPWYLPRFWWQRGISRADYTRAVVMLEHDYWIQRQDSDRRFDDSIPHQEYGIGYRKADTVATLRRDVGRDSR